MTKLSLSKLNFSNTEVLTREQLKKIRGGDILCRITDDQGNNELTATCTTDDLYACTMSCVEFADSAGGLCGGCAEFPA